jgi:hypothetical protein
MMGCWLAVDVTTLSRYARMGTFAPNAEQKGMG